MGSVAAMPGGIEIEVVEHPGQAAEIEDLVARAAQHDGFRALNEAADLHLRHPRPGVRHLLARAGDRLAGYAQLAELGERATGQLVVAPEARGARVGRALLDRLLATAGRPVDLWAMGDTPAARQLAAGAGLHRSRELMIMKRPLAGPLPAPELPDGVSIRPFRVGADETAWLELNRRAFAGHPEQGRLGAEDLAERMSEPWFDPDGFLLAVRDECLVGFHWTKQHPGRMGEVYVLGVDPVASGGGVGKALLWAGLEHLRRRGNTAVELYVEGDHARAVALYAAAGFAPVSRDVMYSSTAP